MQKICTKCVLSLSLKTRSGHTKYAEGTNTLIFSSIVFIWLSAFDHIKQPSVLGPWLPTLMFRISLQHFCKFKVGCLIYFFIMWNNSINDSVLMIIFIILISKLKNQSTVNGNINNQRILLRSYSTQKLYFLYQSASRVVVLVFVCHFTDSK